MSAEKKSVYIETTIPSFATAKTSMDLHTPMLLTPEALMEMEGSI
jgi:hypothetical protein